jgi:site-specific recombinase XerD
MDHFFSDPPTVERLREGPLGPYVDRFATLLRERGYARATAQRHIRQVGKLSKWLERRRLTVGDLTHQRVDEFLKHRKARRRYREGDAVAFKILLGQLKGAGVISQEEPQSVDTALDRVERDFAQYLTQERGLSEATLTYYLAFVRQFLSARFGGRAIRFGVLRPKDVTSFVLRKVQDLSPGRAKLMGTALRAFFRYLRLRGEITRNLAACVLPAADWRLTTLPKSLEPKQVESVLKHCDRETSIGLRDYTILLLLARLCLRAGEVVALTLDDLNWEAGEITVRGKNGRRNRLPLSREVGEALVAYLREGRPRCSTRRLFVCARAPVTGFTTSVAISTIVRRALKRAGLDPPRKGAHLFRHTAARQMLRKGATLSEIGEILRHQRPDTTAIYAKVDLARLRKLALPWPGGAV